MVWCLVHVAERCRKRICLHLFHHLILLILVCCWLLLSLVSVATTWCAHLHCLAAKAAHRRCCTRSVNYHYYISITARLTAPHRVRVRRCELLLSSRHRLPPYCGWRQLLCWGRCQQPHATLTGSMRPWQLLSEFHHDFVSPGSVWKHLRPR